MDDAPQKRPNPYANLWWATGLMAVFLVLMVFRLDWLMRLIDPDEGFSWDKDWLTVTFFSGISVLGLAAGWWRMLSVRRQARNRPKPLDMR